MPGWFFDCVLFWLYLDSLLLWNSGFCIFIIYCFFRYFLDTIRIGFLRSIPKGKAPPWGEAFFILSCLVGRDRQDLLAAQWQCSTHRNRNSLDFFERIVKPAPQLSKSGDFCKHRDGSAPHRGWCNMGVLVFFLCLPCDYDAQLRFVALGAGWIGARWCENDCAYWVTLER